MWGNFTKLNQPSCSLKKRPNSLGESKSNHLYLAKPTHKPSLSLYAGRRAWEAFEGFCFFWPSILCVCSESSSPHVQTNGKHHKKQWMTFWNMIWIYPWAISFIQCKAEWSQDCLTCSGGPKCFELGTEHRQSFLHATCKWLTEGDTSTPQSPTLSRQTCRL